MISPKSLMKIATTASVVAMTVSVAVVPAYAMQDIAIEDTPSSFAATVMMRRIRQTACRTIRTRRCRKR